MNSIYFLSGLPGSGKSTWAKEKVRLDAEINVKTKRVGRDDLRAMLDNSKWSLSNEKLVVEIQEAIIDLCLTNGCNVIVDDVNFNPKNYKRVKQIAEIHDAKIIKIPFDTSLEECIRRDREREGVARVGDDVILQIYEKYIEKK